MEQRPKLAAVFLGVCFLFGGFAGVSSGRANNPRCILQEIHNLLVTLKVELKPLTNSSNDMTVTGLQSTHMDGSHSDCAGTFMDVFVNGTKEIYNHFPDHKHKINTTIENILDCVRVLETRDCTKLTTLHKECKNNRSKLDVMAFVEEFKDFSNQLQKMNLCKKSDMQDCDDDQDSATKDIKVC